MEKKQISKFGQILLTICICLASMMFGAIMHQCYIDSNVADKQIEEIGKSVESIGTPELTDKMVEDKMNLLEEKIDNLTDRLTELETKFEVHKQTSAREIGYIDGYLSTINEYVEKELKRRNYNE